MLTVCYKDVSIHWFQECLDSLMGRFIGNLHHIRSMFLGYCIRLEKVLQLAYERSRQIKLQWMKVETLLLYISIQHP